MKKQFTRIIAMLLAFVMILSLTACGNSKTMKVAVDTPIVNNRNEKETLPNEDNNKTLTGKDTAELSREELEIIVNTFDESIDTDKLTDKQLSELADSLLNSLNKDKNKGNIDVTANKDAYDENGAMTKPFDEVYPEMLEEGLVEYSDEALLVKMANSKNGKLTSAMKKTGVLKLEEIVPLEKYTWYKASLKKGTDAQKALEELRELKEVVLAEYDYKIKTTAIDNYKDIDSSFGFENNSHKKDQWYMHHCGIPDGFNCMKYDGGQPNVIVAVIDTGVDIDHEDLAHNIWKNTKEKPNNGIDDDGNGYIDDYYGVNLVAGKGNGDDDNGHGTHVAGIIAARNNHIGTVGIAHKTTVMPIKAAAASGYFSQSDIAKAVLYAYENGAEVINMSFGGSACSIAVQDALATAYTRCVLVASAGNDGIPNEHPKLDSVPNYPAALTYVLGVMAVDREGKETYFTNWDYKLYNGVEYELYAPGYDIMSTLPDNRYGSLSGTSMAAPVVSAMAAILRSEFADRDTYPTKFIYGQLTSTSEHYATCLDPESHGKHNLPQIANLYSALTKLPKPDVGMQDFLLFDTEGLAQDTAKKNNGDGVVDAGETISLGLILRNRWGMSENTKVTLDTKSGAGISDPYVTFVNPTVNYDTVGTYSTQDCGKIYTDELHTGWKNPFIIKISKDCPNDYIVKVNVRLSYENGLDEKDKTVYTNELEPVTFEFTVRNGVVLPSIIDEDMTLTPDNFYIIPNSTVIQSGTTVRVMPGTNIQFWSDDPKDPYADTYIAYLSVKGKFLVEGTKENPVKIYPSATMGRYNVEINETSSGYVSLSYADITNFGYSYSSGALSSYNKNNITYINHCTFKYNYSDQLRYRCLSDGSVKDATSTSIYFGNFDLIENSVFNKINLLGSVTLNDGKYEHCIFADCGLTYNGVFNNCVFLGNTPKNNVTASTINISGTRNFYSSDFFVKYNTLTGTTYIRSRYQLTDFQLEDLGASYAIINNENELDYLSSMFSGVFDLGIEYDYANTRYCWFDGSLIDNQIDTISILENSYGQKLSVYLSTSGYYITDEKPSYYLYEINGSVLPTSITFSEYRISLDVESNYQISPITEPVLLDAKDFVYESSDESVIKVSEFGVVTPVSKGTADVYVYSKDRAVYNYITFDVTDYIMLKDYTFSYPDSILRVGETFVPQTQFVPADTTRKNIKYHSSDDNIVCVDNAGRIRGLFPGNAVITATCEGIVKKFAINVVKNTFSHNLKIGDTLDIGKYFSAEYKDFVKYNVSDNSILSISNGVVSGISSGCATVTAKYNNTVLLEIDIFSFRGTDALEMEKYAYHGYLDAETIALPTVNVKANSDVEFEWNSSDTSVADFVDGKILLRKVGYTLITVTDTLSGLSDTAILYVSDMEKSVVKDIYISRVDSGNNYVLTSQNYLYHFNKIGSKPTLLFENVVDFDVDENNDSYVLVLLEDGSVNELCSNHLNTTFVKSDFDMYSGEELIGIEYCNEQRYAYSNCGNLWVWGNNDSKQLGVDQGSYIYHPTLSGDEISDMYICDVVSVNFMTCLLTSQNELFVIGGEYTRVQDPRLVAKNVTHFQGDFNNQRITYVNDEYIKYIDPYDLSSVDNETNLGIYSEKYVVRPYFYYQYHEYEERLSYHYGYDSPVYFDSLKGVTAMHYSEWDNYLYVVTEDNLLYIVNNGDIISCVPILNEFEAEPLEVVSTNLDENNVLHEKTLRVQFNQPILKFRTDCGVYYTSGVGVSAVEEEIPFTDYYTFTADSWDTTKSYYFSINYYYGPIGAYFTKFKNSVNISFTFDPLPSSTITDNVTVEVHQSVFDRTIERILTADSVASRVNLVHSKNKINSSFYNNVVLNRISTDTIVEHWLRPIAPTTSGAQIPLSHNWWGTTNETAISLQMVDYSDFISYGRFMYAPYLTEAPEDTFPFVTSVKIFNKHGEEVTTVGNEQITVRVTFNRDMDTSIPLQVRFGSAYPYGDYEIEGKYVNARTWEGKYKLTTIIEGGIQYFTISNGCSATDDLELMTDRARFAFEIDTTAAQALIMQGEATDTGIKLTWTQDDFDTLMGYNVYRSTSEDGLYTRVNSSVIPSDTMEFFDDTVEPGVLYYYNFTVVQTDLSESIPSGKIVIMSKDTMAPNIYHSPVYNATTGSNLVISATVTDNLNITYARVYYRTKGETDWRIAVMNNLNDKYSAIIIADHISTEGLEYYIEAFDGVSYTYKGSAENPYLVSVQEVVSGDAMGDINGDGTITNLDALMLLKAINDQLNLTAEQFARADLDGDGILAAKEALRILQYVSGAVGTVDMRG